jgi:hypothetical protein
VVKTVASDLFSMSKEEEPHKLYTLRITSGLLFLVQQRSLERRRQQFWRQFSTGTTTPSHEERTLSLEDFTRKTGFQRMR